MLMVMVIQLKGLVQIGILDPGDLNGIDDDDWDNNENTLY